MSETTPFKTRTEFIPRSNGGLPGVWMIALDIGYSSVKAYSQNETAVFPSFARRFDSELIGDLPNDYILYQNLDTGERWVVGEAAEAEVEQDDATISEEALYGRDRYGDPMFHVLVETGLGIAYQSNDYGTPNDKKILVQTGLPPKYMKTDTKLLKKEISGHHHFSLRLGNAPAKTFVMDIEPSSIDVMEQPMGTLMSVAIDNSHRFVKDAPNYFNKNVLIFDAGFGTLDIFPIQNNHVVSKQTFPEFGMRQVLKQTTERIYEEYSEDVSLVGMQKCLGEGFVRCHDRFSSVNRPFLDLLKESSYSVCDAALERLGQIYPLYQYDYMIITGGTGAAWNEQIREKLKGLSSLSIINGNQNDTSLPFLYANVRGYYMYLYEKTRRVQKNQSH